MYLVDLETALDRLPRGELELVMRKKGIPEVLVTSIMILYERAE